MRDTDHKVDCRHLRFVRRDIEGIGGASDIVSVSYVPYCEDPVSRNNDPANDRPFWVNCADCLGNRWQQD